MERIKLYSKEGELISSVPVSNELCQQINSLSEDEALREIAIMISLMLKNDAQLEVTPEQVLSELSRVVVCGREIEVKGGNPA